MESIKRVIIFLLVAVGVFATVEFISYKFETADNWGVSMAPVSGKSATVKQTASVKTPHAQAHKKSKASALSS